MVIIVLKMTVTMMMVMLMINLSFELYSRLFPMLGTPPY